MSLARGVRPVRRGRGSRLLILSRDSIARRLGLGSQFNCYLKVCEVFRIAVLGFDTV